MSNQPARPFGDPGQILSNLVSSAGQVGRMKNEQMEMGLRHSRGVAAHNLQRQNQMFQQEMALAEFNMRHGTKVPTNMREAHEQEQRSKHNYESYARELGPNEVGDFSGMARSAQIMGSQNSVAEDIMARSAVETFGAPLSELDAQMLGMASGVGQYFSEDESVIEHNRAKFMGSMLGIRQEYYRDKVRRTLVGNATTENLLIKDIQRIQIDNASPSANLNTVGASIGEQYGDAFRQVWGWVPGVNSMYSHDADSEVANVDDFKEMIKIVNNDEKDYGGKALANLGYGVNFFTLGLLGSSGLSGVEAGAFGDDGYANSKFLGSLQYFDSLIKSTSGVNDIAVQVAKKTGITDSSRLDFISSQSGRLMNILVKGHMQHSEDLQQFQKSINKAASEGNDAAAGAMVAYVQNRLGITLEPGVSYSGPGGGYEALRGQVESVFNVVGEGQEADQMRQDLALIGQIVGDVAQFVGHDWSVNLDLKAGEEMGTLSPELKEQLTAAFDGDTKAMVESYKNKGKITAAQSESAARWFAGFEELMGGRHASKIELQNASSMMAEVLAPWNEEAMNFRSDPYGMTEALSMSINEARVKDIDTLNNLNLLSGPLAGNMEAYDELNPVREDLIKIRDRAVKKAESMFRDIKDKKSVPPPKSTGNPVEDAIMISAYNAAKEGTFRKGLEGQAIIDSVQATRDPGIQAMLEGDQ